MISLCLLRDRHWLQRSESAACAAHWIQEHSISKDLCLGSSSSVIRGLLDGISVKEQRVLLFPWLCHCCDKHFPVFVCLSLCSHGMLWHCSSSLYFIAASRKRRERFPLLPEGAVHVSPVHYSVHVLTVSSQQGRASGSWSAVHTAETALFWLS